MNKTQFVRFQVSLFFKSDYTGQFENASLAIKKEFSGDIETQILGLPSNMPSEIPRLIVKSTVVDINLSKNRIDFSSIDSDFFEKHSLKILSILSTLLVEVGRIGVVVTSFTEVSTEEFRNIFDQSRISSIKPKEITVRLNEVLKLAGVNVNNSQTYETGVLNENTITRNGVIIVRDINSLAEDLSKNSFNKESIIGFVEASILKAKEIIF